MNTKDFKIVCVDDDKDVLEVTTGLLEACDYNCIGFTKVEDALKYILLNKQDISMILSDLRMDDIDGFEFKRMLKAEAGDIPFVVITGFWTKEMSAEAMETGISAFIEKPVSDEIMFEQIEKFAKVRAELLLEEREMVEGFLEESSPMLDEIEQLILELEEQPDSEQTLSTYFRLLHTIKGTASCVGLTQLAGFTHKYEDFIGELRTHKLVVNTITTNVLLEGLDDLKKIFSQTLEVGSDALLDITDSIAKFEPSQYLDTSKTEVKEGIPAEGIAADAVIHKDKKDEDKMSVPMSVLNEFMEESGELTVIRNSILKTVKQIETRYRGDREIELLNDLLDGMYNVTSNIQGKITEMRKVSVKHVFRPFKRLVRDLSKKLKKNVEFELVGEELFIDNIVTKLFNNTLIHIIRNSLDHDLEAPEIRENSGKDKTGKLVINVQEEGEDIVLHITDDGKGIDSHIIRSKAMEKGLYTASQLDQMSELEIVNIVFDSGFSTAEAVTDLSGRGVGMDMVRSSFEEMGGSVFVKTEVGLGSTFVLRVPVPKSVLIINTLSVSCGQGTYIFPMDEVAEVIRYESESVNSKMYDIDGELVLKHNDQMIELRALTSVLEIPGAAPINPDSLNLVVLRVGEQKFGVIVDEIHEFEEVVSRKINDQIESRDLYHGASLLGNGEVGMILSAAGMAEKIGIQIEASSKKFLDVEKDEKEIIQEMHEYMVFKYNADEFLAVPLDDVERLEKIEKSKIEYVGNNHIVRYQNKTLPLIEPAGLLKLHNMSVEQFIKLRENELLEVIIVNIGEAQYGVLVAALDEIQISPDELNTEISSDGIQGTVYINGHTLSIVNLEHIAELYKSIKVDLRKLEISNDEVESTDIDDHAVA